MDLILDTNAVSALADGDPAAIRAFLRSGDASLPVIVLGEYLFGIAQSRNRIRYEEWLSDFAANSEVLNVDEQTAAHYARINVELKKSGRPIPSNDIWIAALALQHAQPIMTRDNHFDAIKGIRRLTWG
jgi:predicted nucleic acid-binding protein